MCWHLHNGRDLQLSSTKHNSQFVVQWARKQTNSQSITFGETPHSASCHLLVSLFSTITSSTSRAQKTKVGSWWRIANVVATAITLITNVCKPVGKIKFSENVPRLFGPLNQAIFSWHSSSQPAVCVNTFRWLAALALVLPKWMKSAKWRASQTGTPNSC